jgi:hypothetical protein
VTFADAERRKAGAILNRWRQSHWLGQGLGRPFVAYLAVVLIVVWLEGTAQALQQGSDVVNATFGAAVGLLSFGFVLWAALAIGLLPALALNVVAISRAGVSSLARRSMLGSLSWLTWGLAVGLAGLLAGTAVLDPGAVASNLVGLSVAGAVFAAMGFRGQPVRPGRLLAIASVGVVLFAVVGAIWTAGHWGGAADSLLR